MNKNIKIFASFLVIIMISFSSSSIISAESNPDAETGKTMPDAGTGKAKPDAGTGKQKPDAGTGKEKPDAGTGKQKPDAGTKQPTPTLPILRNPLAGLGVKSVGDMVGVVVRFVVVVGSPLCALAIIWAGFTYLLAQGDPGKIKKAHDQLWWTIVGTMIVFGASLIAKVITGTITELLK